MSVGVEEESGCTETTAKCQMPNANAHHLHCPLGFAFVLRSDLPATHLTVEFLRPPPLCLSHLHTIRLQALG